MRVCAVAHDMGGIYLFELSLWVDALSDLQTFYYASGDGYGHVTAPGYYEPRIMPELPAFSMAIAQDLKTFGRADVTFSEVPLANADGGLDFMLRYGFGHACRLLYGDSRGPYSGFVEVASGKSEQPVFDFLKVLARFRDCRRELDKPFQPARFAGTNSGVDGIEGTDADLKGRVKPRLLGEARNFTPPLLNSSRLIYGFNFDTSGATAPSYAIDAVRDGGDALTVGTARANLAALQANTPSAGYFDYCLSESLIRCGSEPVYGITVDARQQRNRPAQMAEDVLLDAGVPASRISAVSMASFTTDTDVAAGLYVDSDVTYAAVMDSITGGVGGFYYPDAASVYHLLQLKEPDDEPVVTFKRFSPDINTGAEDGDIIRLARVATANDGQGVPCKRTTLSFSRNYTPQAPSQLVPPPSITAAEQADYGEAWRKNVQPVSDDDALIAEIVQKYPFAQSFEWESCICDADDAYNENARRFQLYSEFREMYEVEVALTADLAARIRIGVTVALQLPRFGLDAGKNFVVTQQALSRRAQASGGTFATLKMVIFG